MVLLGLREGMLITWILALVASFVKGARVELEADDGEDDDREQNEKCDLEQRRHGLQDGLQDDLKTWRG